MQGNQTPPSQPSIASTPPAQPAAPQLDGLSYQQLKARQDELLTQRQTLANRRQSIGSEYERASGANKAGLGDRIVTLDKSIVQMETDISALGQAMAKKAPYTEQPPGGIRHWRDTQVAGLGFFLFFGTVLFMNMFWRRVGPRRWASTAHPMTNTPQSNERLDRIEQAVDTIAVEIERISENQRFMTRLMTETQLAGTIAQVRSSAEAAKSEVG
jgi:hypothetical protein